MTIYKGDKLIAGGALPDQSGKAGKYLKTDGSNVISEIKRRARKIQLQFEKIDEKHIDGKKTNKKAI